MTKYSIRDRVFIVWGGNLSLAEKVLRRFESKGKTAIVGGNAQSAHEMFYLGPRVIEQINAATHSVILANPTFNGTDKRAAFRENLMFEWGYLIGRMPSQSIRTYLLGCKRSDLPSDLQGAFSSEVPDLPERPVGRKPTKAQRETFQAKYICDDFLATRNDWRSPTAFQVLAEWPFWKRFIEDQIGKHVAPEPAKLRRTLRYAFIPFAYYVGSDPEYFDRILSEMNLDGEAHVQDLIAIKGIAEYLRVSRQSVSIKAGEFDAIKRSFSFVANPITSEVALLTRYTMGLCLLSESFHKDHTPEEASRLQAFAVENFEAAHMLLHGGLDLRRRGIRKTEIDGESVRLWNCFICGNLAKAKYQLGNKQESIDLYKICLEDRQFIQGQLFLRGDRQIAGIFRIETLIHRLRFLYISGSLTTDEIAEAEAEMHEMRSGAPHQLLLLQREIERARKILSPGH